jgi:hypothetical protein
MASLSGLRRNQIAVGRALDGAFNNSLGFGAAAALFGLSASEIGYALTVLSGSNASVGQSASLAAGGQFAALMANRAATRQAAPQSAEQAACANTATSCEEPTKWSAWGTAFGGAQWLNAEQGSASPAARRSAAAPSAATISAADRRGPGGRPQHSNYYVPFTGANGRATGAHFGVYGMQTWEAFISAPPRPAAASTAPPPARSWASA